MYLHANQNAYMTCNFNCHIKTDRLLKLTGSHLHCTCGTIMEWCEIWTSLLKSLTTKWYMSYWIAPFSVPLTDLQGNAAIAILHAF